MHGNMDLHTNLYPQDWPCGFVKKLNADLIL